MTEYEKKQILAQIEKILNLQSQQEITFNYASSAGEYQGFSGIIDWLGTFALVKSADFILDKYGDAVIFKRGEWLKGIWNGGTWQNGTWQNGIWRLGIWESGEWQNGDWLYGEWQDGFFCGGHWQDGTWLGGHWLNGANWITGKDSKMREWRDAPDKWI